VALLVDTDLLIDLERGSDSLDLEGVLGEEERAISVITVSELLHGVLRAHAGVRARRRAFVEHVIAGFEAVPITEPVARVHSEIWAGLAERGETIGSHDLWIAATALAHGFGVATGNATQFERVAGLRVVGARR
jgi:tRNA(fMet)-specific endonuclease VapC